MLPIEPNYNALFNSPIIWQIGCLSLVTTNKYFRNKQLCTRLLRQEFPPTSAPSGQNCWVMESAHSRPTWYFPWPCRVVVPIFPSQGRAYFSTVSLVNIKINKIFNITWYIFVFMYTSHYWRTSTSLHIFDIDLLSPEVIIVSFEIFLLLIFSISKKHFLHLDTNISWVVLVAAIFSQSMTCIFIFVTFYHREVFCFKEAKCLSIFFLALCVLCLRIISY